jgi:hypothetical protein
MLSMSESKFGKKLYRGTLFKNSDFKIKRFPGLFWKPLKILQLHYFFVIHHEVPRFIIGQTLNLLIRSRICEKIKD